MARPRGNRKSARLTVSLDDGTYATLNVLARQEDVYVTRMVRRAVNDFIQRQETLLTKPGLSLPCSPVIRAATPKDHR